MATPNVTKDSKIIIVGGGVFGLSTALHLLKRGYSSKNIQIFDSQPFDENHYNENLGAHGASCDLNKIVRASYGGQALYQDLAFKAMPVWEEWNNQLAKLKDGEIPGLEGEGKKLWHRSGFLRVRAEGLDDKEEETQRGFPEELRGTQYRITDEKRVADAQREGIPKTKFDPFKRAERGLYMDGVLDMTAGYVLASRACAWALYLVKKEGVRCHFGQQNGLKKVLREGRKVKGIETVGGENFEADLVVAATGGWTPSLVPAVEQLLETTAGSVLSVQLPEHRKDLWEKYGEEKFPVWTWDMSGYKPHDNNHLGGLYGLPRTPEGIVKVAFRGAKWTSYSRHNSKGEKMSYPDTSLDKVPAEAMRVIRNFCQENLPDLLELDLKSARLCWYTDSIDNDWLIDYVPGTRGLVVASGGSGHGFKFLPVLGEHIVDVIEGKDTEYTRLFKWREVPDGKRNGLEQGPGGWRVLEKQKMVGNREWRNSVDSKL